jgi:hypothetical protein
MITYRRFNFAFLAASLSPVLAIGLFNIAVDPYGIINSPTFLGVNQSKPEKETNVRLFKAVDITRIKPVTVLLGSSRADYGLDPAHPALANKQPAYNLALVGPNAYEIRRYLQHAITNQDRLNLVILGVDFFMFNDTRKNAPDFSEVRLNASGLILDDFISTTFSWGGFSSSLQTLLINISDPSFRSYHPNGRHYPRRIDEDRKTINYRFTRSLTLALSLPELYGEFELSNKFLRELKTIVELCEQRGITLKIYISPSHATQWEAVRAAGLWPVFEQWKRELVKIAPCWDFSGYNSITTEPITENIKNYIDSSHHRKEVGDLVLNRLLDYSPEMVPGDFGVFLTSDNIEYHLATIRAARQVWAENNPDEVKLVRDIKRSL